MALLLVLPAATVAQSTDCARLDGRTHMRTYYPDEGPEQLWCSQATTEQCPTTYST